MNNASEVLLIVVSTTLTIFLIVGIIAISYLIKILKNIRNITEKADHIADQAESVTAFFQKSAGTAALGKLVANIVNTFKSGNDKDDK